MFTFDWKKLEWPLNLLAAVDDTLIEDKDAIPDDIFPSVMYAIGTLPKDVANTILLRFMYGKTLKEIGELTGVTTERARQRQKKGLFVLGRNPRRRYLRLGVNGAFKEDTARVKDSAYREGYVAGRYEESRARSFEASLPNDISKRNPSSVTIEELNLSVRSFNCLKRSGLVTLADILELTVSDLKTIRNLGLKSVHEIQFVLKSIGYVLKEDHDESEGTD